MTKAIPKSDLSNSILLSILRISKRSIQPKFSSSNLTGSNPNAILKILFKKSGPSKRDHKFYILLELIELVKN